METQLAFQSAAQLKHSVGAFLLKKIKWIFLEVVFLLHKERLLCPTLMSTYKSLNTDGSTKL